jgi:retron-type reverse transcriptase
MKMMIMNESMKALDEYYDADEVMTVLKKYHIKDKTALILALKIERWKRLLNRKKQNENANRKDKED